MNESRWIWIGLVIGNAEAIRPLTPKGRNVCLLGTFNP